MLRKAIMGKGGYSDSDKNRFEMIQEISINKFHIRNQVTFKKKSQKRFASNLKCFFPNV